MNQDIKRCARCILPESYPGIEFDSEGVCNYCRASRPSPAVLGPEKLVALLRTRPSSCKYDCVVPISGGKDSTYILYYVVKHLALKPIAVTYDSGFQHQLSLANARRACEILGVPLAEVRSPRALRVKMLKESLRVSEKLGNLWRVCGNCEATLRTVAMQTAKKSGTPFILWGSSALESGDDTTYAGYRAIGSANDLSRGNWIRRIIGKIKDKNFDRIYRAVYSRIGYHSLKYGALSIAERFVLGYALPYRFRPHAIPPFEGAGCKFVHFFDYVAWDSLRLVDVLKQQLDWKHPEGQDSRWDCAIHSFANLDSLRRIGITDDGRNYCNFIRENKTSRDEAMRNEQHLKQTLDRECQEIAGAIGVPDFELLSHGDQASQTRSTGGGR